MSQLFGMDNVLSALQGNYTKVSNEQTKTSSTKNTIGKPELSEKASTYYEELKLKYGDMEFVLVDDEHTANAKDQASNIATDKELIVFISESEVEKMATDGETRTKNEKIIDDARAQMPDMMKKLEESGISAKSFGIELNGDGTLSYFAVIDKSMAAQKERIEKNLEEKREEKKAEAKEDLTTVTASSFEELIKKIQTVYYEAKADNMRTEQEKMVGQSFDFSV